MAVWLQQLSLNGFSTFKINLFRAALSFFWLVIALACQDREAADRQAAIDVFFAWSAESAPSDSESCHAYGLIKHPETSCLEMLEHAKRILASQREVTSSRTLECFDSICGDFIEIEVEGEDLDGREVKEIVVLKKDSNVFKVYWYRTNSLATAIENRSNSQSELIADAKYLKKQEQLSSAYAYLTNKIPELYQFPSCLDVRITSSNLSGALLPLEKVTLLDFSSRASKCDGDLCVGLVGKKIAAVCQEIK